MQLLRIRFHDVSVLSRKNCYHQPCEMPLPEAQRPSIILSAHFRCTRFGHNPGPINNLTVGIRIILYPYTTPIILVVSFLFSIIPI